MALTAHPKSYAKCIGYLDTQNNAKYIANDIVRSRKHYATGKGVI